MTANLRRFEVTIVFTVMAECSDHAVELAEGCAKTVTDMDCSVLDYDIQQWEDMDCD